MGQYLPRLSRQLPPRTTDSRLMTILGKSVVRMAVRTSVIIATTGVEIIGKPKPTVPCASAANTITTATAMPMGECNRASTSITARCVSVHEPLVARQYAQVHPMAAVVVGAAEAHGIAAELVALHA